MEGLEALAITESIFERGGYLLIFLTSFVESSPFGWLTPGGLVLAIGGFFSGGGHLRLFYVILYGFLGTWLTQLLGYKLGQRYGMRIAKALNQEKNAERANRILQKQGAIVMTTTLTSNITRFWVSYVAGTKRYDQLKFIQYSGIASISWVLVWAVAGFLAGGERGNLEKLLPRLGMFSWILLLLTIVGIIWASKKEYEEFEKGEE